MSKLPLRDAKEVSKILQKMGFVLDRQHGSHMFFKHPDGRTTTIPSHGGEEIDRGLLNKIIRKDIQIERDEFLKYC